MHICPSRLFAVHTASGIRGRLRTLFLLSFSHVFLFFSSPLILRCCSFVIVTQHWEFGLPLSIRRLYSIFSIVLGPISPKEIFYIIGRLLQLMKLPWQKLILAIIKIYQVLLQQTSKSTMTIKFMSLNVKGLNSPFKHKLMWAEAQRLKGDVLSIQETNFSASKHPTCSHKLYPHFFFFCQCEH